MSERREKKRRYNLLMEYIDTFYDWFFREPPMWRIFAWRRWKRERPIWSEWRDRDE